MNSILTSAVKLFEVSNVREMHKNNPETIQIYQMWTRIYKL